MRLVIPTCLVIVGVLLLFNTWVERQANPQVYFEPYTVVQTDTLRTRLAAPPGEPTCEPHPEALALGIGGLR
ncbi:MAG: hypothetical protein AAF743_09140 [Planctomycetota bacterium]